MKNVACASLIVFALVVASPGALAEDPEATGPNMSTAPTAPQILPSDFATQGMKVFLNPETGEFRQPTPEEAAALRQFLFQRFEVATPAPVQHQLADGTVYAQLDPSLHEAVTATTDADGHVSLSCEAGHAEHVHHEAPVREER